MSFENLDERFCRAALDGLKAYGLTEFILRLLKKHRLPVGRNLAAMWAEIESWLRQDPSRCRTLWEYVDGLRMWGRQRVFLYEVEAGFAEELKSPDRVRELVGSVYDHPLFQWETEEPFVASVKHEEAPGAGARRLVFKLIDNRSYKLLVEDKLELFAERSTNFFIVDLQNRHAELRIQELPTGAVRDIQEERRRLESVLGKSLDPERVKRSLDLERVKPINLLPAMDAMLRGRVDTYTITATKLKFNESEVRPNAPELVAFLDGLFRRPDPVELSAYWECQQEVLGQGRLHFRLSGQGDSVGFGGIADPARVNDILEKLVDVTRHTGDVPPPRPPLPQRGAVDGWMKAVQDHPTAQAVILSAGVIAASIFWILAEAAGNYLYDELLDWLLRGLPVIVLTVPLEIAWVIFFYGWLRVRRGFRMLLSLPQREVRRAFFDAWKRRH